MPAEQIFDEWPDKYESWFFTPIGSLVRRYEADLISDLLQPQPGDRILDAGCGTGVFTADILDKEAGAVGVDVSKPMLDRACLKFSERDFAGVLADILHLPFHDEYFDKTVSITAIEFIADAEAAIRELFRVTKKGGSIVVATLNSLSPWAERRRISGEKDHDIFRNVFFRSPDDMNKLRPGASDMKTAIHFEKNADVEEAVEIEAHGRQSGLETGAFLAARWYK